MFGLLVSQQDSHSVGYSAIQTTGWLGGGLVDVLVGWLVGWLVSQSLAQ